MIGQSPQDIPQEQVEILKEQMGLDAPLPVQYVRWLGGWVGRGELGRSYQDNRPVLEVIGQRIPATVLLLGTSMILSFSLGITWGLFLVWLRLTNKRRSLEDWLVASTLCIYSIPAFLIGLMAIFLVTWVDWLHFVPVFSPLEIGNGGSFLALLPFALLPAVVLGLSRGAKVALFIRSLALDEIPKNYVVLALAKGVSFDRVILIHVGRNCLLPIINLLALSLPALIGGSVLIETIFGWPGIGRLAVDATFGRNYPVGTCLILIYGVMVILANLISDLLSIVVDPRLKETDSQSKSGLGDNQTTKE